MVVSAAFGELTEVLECLEASNAEVKNVEIGEQLEGEQDEITANLTVGVPVLDGVDVRDSVSIRAENVDLRDGCVDVDLCVSLSVEQAQENRSPVASGVGTSTGRTDSKSVPAYKDPDALQTVYEKYDTFPEMTEALGADVTSETVRRYMVEYDIHDPNETGPQVHGFADTDGTGGDTSDENSMTENGVTRSSEVTPEEKPESDSPETSGDGPLENSTEDEERTPTATGTRATAKTVETDAAAGNESTEPGTDEADASELDDTSVAELIAATDSGDGDDSVIADGLGIPKDLTVSELASIVNEANTFYEVKTALGVDRDHARHLLEETALIDLVTQRLGADQITVTPREVRRRIDLGTSVVSQ